MLQTDQEIFQKFCHYGRLTLRARDKCIGLLPDIYKRRIYLQKGFESIYEFAAKLAGLSHEQVNRVLNLEKRIVTMPVLHQALVAGEVSVNKLRKAVTIATLENQQEILESVKVLSVSAVETMVRDYKSGHVTTQNDIFSAPAQAAEQASEELQLSPEITRQLLTLQKKGADINKLLGDFLQQIEPATAKSRYIPATTKAALHQEFGQTCSVPGCQKPHSEIHHLLPYSVVKQHNPRLMVQLCREHHQITHRINRQNLAYAGRK